MVNKNKKKKEEGVYTVTTHKSAFMTKGKEIF